MTNEITKLPAKITVVRSFTYDTDRLKESFVSTGLLKPTDSDLLDIIWELATNEHNSPIGKNELIMIDSDTGEEL